jgi:hypothetical protein
MPGRGGGVRAQVGAGSVDTLTAAVGGTVSAGQSACRGVNACQRGVLTVPDRVLPAETSAGWVAVNASTLPPWRVRRCAGWRVARRVPGGRVRVVRLRWWLRGVGRASRGSGGGR